MTNTILFPTQSRIPHLAYSIAARQAQARQQCASSSRQWKRSASRSKPAAQCRYASTTTTSSSSSSSSPPLPSRLLYRSTPQNKSPTAKPRLTNRQGRPLTLFTTSASLFAFSFALYCAYTVTSFAQDLKVYNSPNSQNKLIQNQDVSNRFDRLERDYDEEVDFSEMLMGMGRKRKRVCREASGSVLEVGCGTGRNLNAYNLSLRDDDVDEGVESLVFVDKSAAMIGVAREKWEEMFEKLKRRRKKERERWGNTSSRVEWVVGDVGVRGTVRRPEGGFDTIVQTMGLCSYVDPVGVLRGLGKLVRQPGEKRQSSKSADEGSSGAIAAMGRAIFGKDKEDVVGKDDEGGKIILLEHGRSHHEWLNRFLDTGAAMHADRYGCWFNRDIGRIVEQSGLRVERVRRYHLGTTWEVVLRPKKGAE